MATKTGGEAVVEAIVTEGIEVVFGNPGVHVLDIYDALRDERRVRHICVNHEATAAFMAEGYGRLAGKPGVCVVTAGPGATNSATGVAQALVSASPMVHISGTVPSGARGELTHTLFDPRALARFFEPITKRSIYVERLEECPEALAEAFQLARSGRPGPVHVELPLDVLSASAELPPYVPRAPARQAIPPETAHEVARLLAGAKAPVIYAGRDVLRCHASAELRELVERTHIPLVEATRDRGTLPDDHPLYAGFKVGWMTHPAADDILEGADLVLAIGVLLGSTYTSFLQAKGRTLIDVELEENPLAKPFDRRIAAVGDIKPFLANLIGACARYTWPTEEPLTERLAALRDGYNQQLEDSYHPGASPIHPGYLMRVLRECLERDAVVTVDSGTNSVVARRYMPIYTPNSSLGTDWYASMGCSLAYAMVSRLLFPKRQVVCVVGDAGFLMSYADFPTAVREGLNIVVVVENNGGLGAIHMLQEANFSGRTFQTDTLVPDLAAYARCCGAEGYRVESPEELRGALEDAFRCGKPAIVDVNTERNVPLPLWKRV